MSIIGCVVNGPGKQHKPKLVLLVAVKIITFCIYLEFHTQSASSDIIDKVVKLVEEKPKRLINDPNSKSTEIIRKYRNLKKNYPLEKLTQNYLQINLKSTQIWEYYVCSKEYINYESNKKDLKQIIEDKSNDTEMMDMAKKDLNELEIKKQKMRII